MVFTINYGSAAAAFAALCILRFIYLVVYRLYFSPLAGFPGSKLAAATGWYEFYYDFVYNGHYVFEIERMHEKYGTSYNLSIEMHVALIASAGPIIRVNPVEISIHDPTFYNEVYVTESKRRTEHYDAFVKGIDFDGTYAVKLVTVLSDHPSLAPSHEGPRPSQASKEANGSVLLTPRGSKAARPHCRGCVQDGKSAGAAVRHRQGYQTRPLVQCF